MPYDRNQVREEFVKDFGATHSSEQIDQLLTNWEKQNGITAGAPTPQPEDDATTQAKAYQFDPTQAKQLLKESKNDGNPKGMMQAWEALPDEAKYALGAGAAALGLYGAKKATNIASRMFTPSQGVDRSMEPSMDVTRSNEPYFDPNKPLPFSEPAPSNEPPAPKVNPKELAVTNDFNKKYSFTLEDAKSALNLTGVTITDPKEAEVVAKQYQNQMAKQAGYVSNLANNTPSPAPENSPASPTTATSEKLPAVNESVPPPGMREQYAKGKKNPIGPGGYNWIAGQEGAERAPATWKNLFGEKNVPYAEAMQKFREFELTGQEPGRGLNEIPRSAMGGSHKTPKYIPEYIKGNANIGGMVGAAGGALAALGAVQAFRHGEETGDWTPAGEFGLNTAAGLISPALMFGTHMTGLNAEEDKKLAQKKYEAMVGSGRGIAPPSPRSQVGRR